jgi:hypothetical protein
LLLIYKKLMSVITSSNSCKKEESMLFDRKSWHKGEYYIALGTWPPKGFGPDLDVPREFLPGLWALYDRRASSEEIEHIYDNFGAVLSARRI